MSSISLLRSSLGTAFQKLVNPVVDNQPSPGILFELQEHLPHPLHINLLLKLISFFRKGFGIVLEIFLNFSYFHIELDEIPLVRCKGFTFFLFNRIALLAASEEENTER